MLSILAPFAFNSPRNMCYDFWEMKKSLVTVGFNIPDPDVEHLKFKSSDSILDADVVVFCPNMAEYSAEYGDGFAAGR